MTALQIANWLASGESSTPKFMQSSAEKERASRVLCAIANGKAETSRFQVTMVGKTAVHFHAESVF